MRILIVHLSDAHVKGLDDSLLRRLDELAKAIVARREGQRMCVIAFTGDLAYSGDASQYLLVLDFLIKLRDVLKREWGNEVSIYFASIPGNHDCNFPPEDDARKAMLSSLSPNPTQVPQQPIIDFLCGVQDDFFDFIDATNDGNLMMRSRLYYEYAFPREKPDILFRCYNTAWVSQNPEQIGKIVFPSDPTLTEPASARLVVSMLHHPFPWFSPTNRRAFERYVRDRTDIILTGHEHVADRNQVTGRRGETNLYIEGAVLQDSKDPLQSSFSAILLDLGEGKQKMFSFSWQDETYALIEESPWEDFQVNRLRGKTGLVPNDEWMGMLQNPGIALTHRTKGEVELEDIYIWPDLKRFDYTKSESTIIRSEDALDSIRACERSFVLGDEQAGKTSLGKMLFLKMLSSEITPVMLDGHDLKMFGGVRDLEQVEAAFKQQYFDRGLEAFKRLPKSQRAIIVDDFHRTSFKGHKWKAFLHELSEFASTIIFLSAELTHEIEQLLSEREAISFDESLVRFKILPFRPSLRAALIQKWILLDSDVEPDEHFAERVNVIERILNSVIGKGVFQPWPVTLLPVLQLVESAREIDTLAASHAYFTDELINMALSQNRGAIDQDTIVAFLSYFANWLLEHEQIEVSPSTLTKIHAEYCKSHRRDVPYDELLDVLTRARMLSYSSNGCRFRDKPVRYYFTAKYFAANLTEPEIRERIETMCAAVYREDYANIILFLSHFAPDSFIVDSLIKNAKGILPNRNVVTFDGDIDFLDALAQEAERLPFIERDLREEQQRRLQAADELDGGDAEPYEEEQRDEKFEEITQFNRAVKTVQILGQILKNKSGSMKAAPKLAIAEECYKTIFRCLDGLFGLFRGKEEDLIRITALKIIEQNPDIGTSDLIKQARQSALGLMQAVAFILVKKLALSIGSRNLVPTIEEDLMAKFPSSAMLLTRDAIELDHAAPDSDLILDSAKRLDNHPFAFHLFGWFVFEHMRLFNVGLRQRQRWCDAMGVKRLPPADPKGKLLPRQVP